MDTSPRIRVIGTAERNLAPDRCHASFSTETPIRHSPESATEDLAIVRRMLLDRLREAHPEATITDSRVRVGAHYDYQLVETVNGDMTTTERQRVLVGYVGTCSIQVEDEANRAAAIIANANAVTSWTFNAPVFRVSNERRAEALAELECEAIGDARRRADRQAAAAGCRIARVLTIGIDDTVTDLDDYSSVRYNRMAAPDEFEDTLGELHPDEITLTAEIVCVFELEPESSSA